MFPWENFGREGGGVLFTLMLEIFRLVGLSLQTICSDPRLISSKQWWGGSTLGLNPAKSTQCALTSFCSFLFFFITPFISITNFCSYALCWRCIPCQFSNRQGGALETTWTQMFIWKSQHASKWSNKLFGARCAWIQINNATLDFIRLTLSHTHHCVIIKLPIFQTMTQSRKMFSSERVKSCCCTSDRGRPMQIPPWGFAHPVYIVQLEKAYVHVL